MCEYHMRVSEVSVFVRLIGKVVRIGSFKVGPVIWQIKLAMQLLLRQRVCPK